MPGKKSAWKPGCQASAYYAGLPVRALLSLKKNRYKNEMTPPPCANFFRKIEFFSNDGFPYEIPRELVFIYGISGWNSQLGSVRVLQQGTNQTMVLTTVVLSIDRGYITVHYNLF